MAQRKYEATAWLIHRLAPARCPARVWAALALSVVTLDAAATDYSGLAVTFVGIPAFFGFSLLLAVLLLLRPSKAKRALASTVAAICGLLAIFLIRDSMQAIRYPDGWVPVALLIGLAALSAFLFCKLMSKQPVDSTES